MLRSSVLDLACLLELLRGFAVEALVLGAAFDVEADSADRVAVVGHDAVREYEILWPWDAQIVHVAS